MTTASDLEQAFARFETNDVGIRDYLEAFGWYSQSELHPLWLLDPCDDAHLATLTELESHAGSFVLSEALAVRLDAARRRDEALAMRTRALPKVPRWLPAWVERLLSGMAHGLYALGRHEEAIAFADRCLRWAPTALYALATKAASSKALGAVEAGGPIEAWFASNKIPAIARGGIWDAPPQGDGRLYHMAVRHPADPLPLELPKRRRRDGESYRPNGEGLVRLTTQESWRACVCRDFFFKFVAGDAYDLALRMLAAGRRAQLSVVVAYVRSKRKAPAGELEAIRWRVLNDALGNEPLRGDVPEWCLLPTVGQRREGVRAAIAARRDAELEHAMWEPDSLLRDEVFAHFAERHSSLPGAAVAEAERATRDYLGWGYADPIQRLELPRSPGKRRSRTAKSR